MNFYSLEEDWEIAVKYKKFLKKETTDLLERIFTFKNTHIKLRASSFTFSYPAFHSFWRQEMEKNCMKREQEDLLEEI